VLVFAAGPDVEVDEGVPVERDSVVVVPPVAEAEELSTLDPGEADPDVEVADDGARVSDVGAADDDPAADDPAGLAAAQEQTALAADWTWRPVTGPHVLKTQFNAAVMMAAEAEEEHWHA